MSIYSKTKLEEIYQESVGTFNNRYILEEQLSIGGMSVTYKVKDIYSEYFNDPLPLVIKIPLKELLTKKDISAFVYSEYKFLRMLNHNNIVKIHDFGIDNETQIPYIIMEYLEGSLLEEIPLHQIQKNEKLLIFYTLLTTISYIHSKNIIHSDITPKNIIVSQNQKISLFDFGISQLTNKLNKFTLNNQQFQAYNIRYAAPEVLKGDIPTISSDKFSLALVLYEIFSLELPFENTSAELEKNPLSYSTCSKEIPFLLRKWFIDTLEINPKKRRQSLPLIYKLLRF